MIKSIPGRAMKGARYLYAVVVALVVAAIVAPAAFAQSNPGQQMIGELQTGVLALLGAGAAIVIAVALFFAAKAFVQRIRS